MEKTELARSRNVFGNKISKLLSIAVHARLASKFVENSRIFSTYFQYPQKRSSSDVKSYWRTTKFWKHGGHNVNRQRHWTLILMENWFVYCSSLPECSFLKHTHEHFHYLQPCAKSNVSQDFSKIITMKLRELKFSICLKLSQ